MRRPPNFHGFEHGGVAQPRFTLLAPALAMLPLIRFPLGYATLSPLTAFKRGVVFLIIPPVFWFLWGMLTHAGPPPNEGRNLYDLYVVVAFVMTVLRFLMRAVGQQRGEEIHTAEAGYSPLTWLLPMPVAFIEQLVMPGLLGWLGWWMLHTACFDLGCWLFACAASYLLVANWEGRNLASRKRAPVDDKIRAQAFSDHIDDHEQQVVKQRRVKAKGKTTPLYGGGDAPDIAELGRGRKSRT
jgi:hypothetical protein